MSSHPGSRLEDAIELALMLKARHLAPEQVLDFYPTPGTVSTVMYYTGIDPLTNKRIYVCTDYHEKQLQRALLQYNRPENAPLVREALKRAGREDLIGHGEGCLVRPERQTGYGNDRTKKPAQSKNKKGAVHSDRNARQASRNTRGTNNKNSARKNQKPRSKR